MQSFISCYVVDEPVFLIRIDVDGIPVADFEIDFFEPGQWIAIENILGYQLEPAPDQSGLWMFISTGPKND